MKKEKPMETENRWDDLWFVATSYKEELRFVYWVLLNGSIK
jgi:hypothetical protein